MDTVKRFGTSFWRALQRFHLAPRLPTIPRREGAPEKMPEPQRAKIVEEYYPQMVARAVAVRSRAQGGYTIAAAIAAAIVTAGALAGIGERALITQALGGLALVLWLLTVVLYAQAVAGHVMEPEDAPAPTGEIDASEALHDVLYERAVLERRLDLALYTTILAVAATILAVGSAWVFPPRSSLEAGELTLTRAGSDALTDVCGPDTNVVQGSFDPDDLEDASVSIELADTACPASTNRTLEVRSRDVAAARYG